MILILVAREGGFLCTEFRLVFVSSYKYIQGSLQPQSSISTTIPRVLLTQRLELVVLLFEGLHTVCAVHGYSRFNGQLRRSLSTSSNFCRLCISNDRFHSAEFRACDHSEFLWIGTSLDDSVQRLIRSNLRFQYSSIRPKYSLASVA